MADDPLVTSEPAEYTGDCMTDDEEVAIAVAPPPEVASAQHGLSRQALRMAAAISALVIVVLLCFARRYGYMADELYFLACAEHPDWGYVDLPPMLPWLTWIVRHTIGTSLIAIRFYPALACGTTALLAAQLASELGGRRRAIVTAAVLVVLSPVVLGTGHVLSTNALDYPLWLAAVLLVVRIEKTGNPRLFIAFGTLAGLALLHKYSLAFYLAALLVGTVLTPCRRWLLNRRFWAGVAVAILIVLPNIFWQAQRGFPFLQLQHNIVANHRNVILSPLQFIFAQALLANLLSSAFIIAGAIFFFMQPMKRFRLLGWAFVAYMLLMYALHVKDYQVAPVYPTMLAAGAVAAESWFQSRWSRRLVFAYTFAAAVLFVLLLPLCVPVLSVELLERYYRHLPLQRLEPEHNKHTSLPDFYSDDFGWRETAEMVSRYYNALVPEERAKTAIIGNFYGEAGAIDFFGPALGLPKAISGHHSYWYWGSRSYTGESAIALDFKLDVLKSHCASVSLVAERDIPWARNASGPIYHCRKLDFDLTQHWDEFKHFD